METTGNQPVDIVDNNGNTVAIVNFEFNTDGGSLVYTISSLTNENAISNTVDLFFIDRFGNFISNFDGSVEICLNTTDNSDKACLSYYDVKSNEWKCEDKCLNSKKGQYCGKTDHFTSFAILLDSTGGGDSCSGEVDHTFAWLSLGFILAALVLFLVLAVIKDISVRYRTYQKGLVMDARESTLLKFNTEAAM